MSTAYIATIEGTPRKVIGWKAHEVLILEGGTRCAFARLGAKERDCLCTLEGNGQTVNGPEGEVTRFRLLEVANLRLDSGDWFVNDESLSLQKWLRLESQRFYSKRGILAQHRDSTAIVKAVLRSKKGDFHPHYWTRVFLEKRLKLIANKPQAQLVQAVAWFDHDDGAGGWNTPVLLTEFCQQINPDGLAAKEANLAADNLRKASKDAAREIRSVNSEMRTGAEQIQAVAQPFREMYKDERMQPAKADALKAGVPELVVDVIVSLYYGGKFPTVDQLDKYLHNAGYSAKLKAAGLGSSRATIGRWLRDFRNILIRRGVVVGSRRQGPQQIQSDLADSSKADQVDEAEGM